MEPKGMQDPSEGMGMPSKMREMMQEMMEGKGDFNPMAMCQAMMTSVSKSAGMAAYATPEVRTLFDEWAQSMEREVLATLKTRGPMDLSALAATLKIAPEGALSFLGRLVREGRVVISGIQVAEGTAAA